MDEGVEATFRHPPGGCPDQWQLESDGELGPLYADLTIMVPVDRTGWSGVTCSACGGALREVTAANP